MYKSLVLSILLLLGIFMSTSAQKQGEIPASQMDAMFKKFQQIQANAAAQRQYEKDLEEMVDEMLVKLKEWIKQKQTEQKMLDAEYKSAYNHKPGEMNLFPVWSEIPEPVPSLPEAKKTDFHTKYELYIDKVTMMKKQLSDMIQDHVGDQRSSNAQMMTDTKSMANKNTFVQQMGGADATMDMSKSERKQSAKETAASIKSNPGAYSSNQNPGMQAMMNRIMSDPQYRDKYNKMTDTQKAEELQKYMGNTVEPRDDKAFEQKINDRNQTYSAQNVELLLGKSLKQMEDAAKPYLEGTELANNFFISVYKQVDDWYMKEFDALPLSKSREKIGLSGLMKCKETILYAFHKQEAVTRTVLWSLLKNNTKIAFGEFNDFIGNYPWGDKKNASLVDGKYTEAKVAQAIVSLYDGMIGMAQGAERLTRNHKGQQEQYETIMNIH